MEHRRLCLQIQNFLKNGSFFSNMSKRAGESFATSPSAKQNPVHCSGPIARTISEKNADVDHHAVPQPKHQAGGDSMREHVCQEDSGRVDSPTPVAASSG